jgi:hypothetical protein
VCGFFSGFDHQHDIQRWVHVVTDGRVFIKLVAQNQQQVAAG